MNLIDLRRKVEVLYELIDLLETNIKADAIDEVLNRPAPAWSGATISDMITRGKEEFVLEHLKKTFDWEQNGI